MKNKNKLKIIILVLGIVFSLSAINNFMIIDDQGENVRTIENRDDSNLKTPRISGYWTTNFIHIDSNWSHTVGNYSWCSGDGLWSNPYIIENVTIDANTSPTGSGIFINNSKNDFFIIKNVTIYNAGSTVDDAGIKLENTNKGTLINNNISNNGGIGILLSNYSENNTISGNTANNNNLWGIYLLDYCNNNNISGNTASNVGTSNQYVGIALASSNNNIISGNTANNNTFHGISLDGDYNTVSGNTANNNNDNGIYLFNSDNNIVSGNTVTNNNGYGIFLNNGCNNNTISGNSANNNLNNGIFFNNGCDNNTISGNTANNNSWYGIYLLDYSNSNIVSGNTANNNTLHGIILQDYCSNNTISGNTANNNIYYGIYLLNYCNNNTISGNTASNIDTSNQDVGIYLNTGCDNNTISGNTANDNILDGIVLYNGCDNNTIPGNTVTNNNGYGIFLNNGCDNNTISENFIYENIVGIRLEADCNDNLLFYNFIFNNSNNNGFDLGSNDWDNGVIGNYWDNYSGIDADYDGIGDTPYNVPGGAGNKDNKPIMIYKAFFFIVPDDLTYEVGTGGYNIKWIIINPSLITLTFNVFRAGTSVKTGQLFSGRKNEIVINVDGLDTGIYGFTIEVDDGSGGTFTDGVWVIVINTNPVFTATPSDFSYDVGDVGNNLSWTFSDVSTNSPTYTITRNGVHIIIDNPCVSGVVIEISADSLEVGYHGFTIEINDGYGGIILDSVWVTVNSSSNTNLIKVFYVEIVDQSFTIEKFNFTFSVYNGSSQGIDLATIQLWWNGIDVSTDIQNFGGGLYFISLNPITVAPGEDPILLNMIISANGYQDKYFDTYLAVDPDTLDKEVGELAGEFPLTIIIIASISIAGGIGVVGITIFILRRRSRLSVSN